MPHEKKFTMKKVRTKSSIQTVSLLHILTAPPAQVHFLQSILPYKTTEDYETITNNRNIVSKLNEAIQFCGIHGLLLHSCAKAINYVIDEYFLNSLNCYQHWIASKLHELLKNI